jgi:hypothetical protein
MPRSPAGSGSPDLPDGCRWRGVRRSGAARRCSCSVPRARSASSPCRLPSCSVRRDAAAGRSAAGLERAPRHGADATLRLDETGDLVAAFKEAFGGEGPSYVFDPLWGEPAAAAVQAAAPRATIVHLGQSGGVTAESLQRQFASRACRFSVTRTTPSLRTNSPSTPAARRPRGRRRDPARGRAGTARLRYRRVAPSGGGRRNEARCRTVGRSSECGLASLASRV